MKGHRSHKAKPRARRGRIAAFITLSFLLILAGPVLLRSWIPDEVRVLEGEAIDHARYAPVRFQNREQDIGLAGMLFAPPGPGPYPAVVIIHGSGDSRRDNRWYLTLTHFLQDHGVMVLLPDKRGSEQSAGEWRSASMEDLATDTLAAVEWLRSRREHRISALGVIGMSQGGWIAPITAARSREIDCIVSMVGSAVTPKQQLLYEEKLNLEQMGVLPGLSGLVVVVSTLSIRHLRQKPFWDANADFDPLPYWESLDGPALALFGSEDSNTPTSDSVERLRSLQKPNIRIRVYDRSGHALEDPPGRANRIIRLDALQDIRDFIRSCADQATG
jgi:pimeloyl-ACP methyl ester carboxylesterase